MYQKEFENLLRTTPPRALMLYGENHYLIRAYIQHYIHLTQAKESLLRQYYDEYNFQIAKNYLAQSSLFGGVNLLIIQSDKKIAPKELEQLIELVGKNPNNYLIFFYQGLGKTAKSLQRLFTPQKGANWVRLFEPTPKESLTLLQKKAQHLKLEIDPYALQHLLLLLHNNLELCANELNKLTILPNKITTKDIDQLVYSTAPLTTEELLVELFEKKPILSKINHLMELGIDVFAILRSTQFFINQLSLFHAYIKLHGEVNSRAILGYQLPKPIEQQRARLALRLKSDTLLQLFEHLLRVELQLKTSPSRSKTSLLYGGLIKLQHLID